MCMGGIESEEVTEELDPITNKLVITKKVIKKSLPNATSQIFWAKHNMSEKYGDKPVDINLEHSVSALEYVANQHKNENKEELKQDNLEDE